MRIRGFTLIELIIVIAMLGIVTVLVLPTAGKALGSSSFSDSGPEPYNAQPVQTQRFQCVQGILFKTQPNGKMVPATDSEARTVKC